MSTEMALPTLSTVVDPPAQQAQSALLARLVLLARTARRVPLARLALLEKTAHRGRLARLVHLALLALSV
jgi:hypothetical protein